MNSPETSRARILIVDDEASTIDVLREILSVHYDVSAVNDGAQALEFCERRPPDLVLLDVMMPGLDGYQVCRRLKSAAGTRDLPVIFVTARDGADDEIRGLEEGAVDFITKPVREAVVLARVRTHVALKRHSDRWREMALTDVLTGLANRRCFEDRLHAEWSRCRRGRSPIALIMIDVDHFKHFNDAFGHDAGDGCLVQVASAMKRGVRRSADLLSRYGGEEFACLLPGIELAQATSRADALGRIVESLAIRHADAAASRVVTISRGVAACVPGANAEPSEFLRAADAMLYAAKGRGRNQTVAGPFEVPVDRVASKGPRGAPHA